MHKASYPRKPYPRKAQTPEEQLASAIKRADENGVKVAGSGTLANGSRFWIVPSQSVDGMHHVVTQHGKSLECDCFYDRMQHKICVHRAATYLSLRAEAAQAVETAHAAAKPTPTPPAPKVSPDFQKKLDSTIFPAPKVERNPATALYGDNTYNGSIFKPERTKGAQARVTEEW